MSEIRSLATALRTSADLEPLVDRLAPAHLVGIGEASHGTSEFYRWRAVLSQQLIQRHGFSWIGVEGDWPDCWRINRWVRGLDDQDLDARQLLSRFERWPTWMWANEEVADFISWLRQYNLRRPADARVAFYGLDVYSLWDSLWRVMSWLQRNAPEALPAALRAWQCFTPYGEDPQAYARATRLVPASCEGDVVTLLAEARRHLQSELPGDEMFDAAQNAEVVAGAERYYRTMVRADQTSWNVRDHHMADTIERIRRHHGPGSKGLVWEHNTHIGDARATDMTRAGLVNVGQLMRERHASDGVALVGFAAHRGTVLAARGWGAPERVFTSPSARAGSHEDLLHHALAEPSVVIPGDDRSGPWLSSVLGHRAIGVVYDPLREAGNYVPTQMGGRYDALIWQELTSATHPLHHEGRPREPELETEPSGF